MDEVVLKKHTTNTQEQILGKHETNRFQHTHIQRVKTNIQNCYIFFLLKKIQQLIIADIDLKIIGFNAASATL